MDISKKIVLKASPYFLEEILGLNLDYRAQEGKISYLLLNQPPVCDAHCRRCFMPEYRRVLKNSAALSLAESKFVLEKARDNGALCLEISGEGEPTLSANLPIILQHASNLGYFTTLITNGHHLDRPFINLCVDSNVSLVISHFSSDPLRYESDNLIKGSYIKKLENILLASSLYEGTKKSVNGCDIHRLAIHATLQSDNIPDLLSLQKFCQGKGIFFSVAPLAQSGCALDHPEMEPVRSVSIAGELVPLEQVPLKLGDNSIIHSHSSKQEIGREVCGTCLYGLNIGYDGALLLDAHSGYELSGHLGNVRTTPFNELVWRQRYFALELFRSIDGFCPVRDLKWSDFLSSLIQKFR